MSCAVLFRAGLLIVSFQTVFTEVFVSTDDFASPPVSLNLAAIVPDLKLQTIAFVVTESGKHELLCGSTTGHLYLSVNYNAAGKGVSWKEIASPLRNATVSIIRLIVAKRMQSCFRFAALSASARTGTWRA